MYIDIYDDDDDDPDDPGRMFPVERGRREQIWAEAHAAAAPDQTSDAPPMAPARIVKLVSYDHSTEKTTYTWNSEDKREYIGGGPPLGHRGGYGVETSNESTGVETYKGGFCNGVRCGQAWVRKQPGRPFRAALYSKGEKVDSVLYRPSADLTMSRPEILEPMHKLFQTVDPEQLGVGADANGRLYARMFPLLVYDVGAKSSDAYFQRRDALAATACPVVNLECTRTEKCFATYMQTLNMRADVNEKLLLHGADPRALKGILEEGFKKKFAPMPSGGLFGRGTYFADDAAKSDQYCKPLDSYWIRLLGLPSEMQVADDLVTEYYGMLMSRVVVGCPARVTWTTFQDNLTISGQRLFSLGARIALPRGLGPFWTSAAETLGVGTWNTLASPWTSIATRRHGAALGGKFRYREFVNFDDAIAQPTQLIVYARVKQPGGNYGWADEFNILNDEVARGYGGDPFNCPDGTYL